MRNLKQTVLGGHLGLALNGAKTYQTFAGTVALTNGGTTLTGTGTTFTSGMAGKTFAINLSSDPINPNIVIVTIQTFTDTTHVELSTAWEGDTLTGLTGYSEGVNPASATNKPVTTVPANWLSLGSLADKPTYKANREYDTVMKPGPAAMVPCGKLPKKIAPTFEVDLNEISEDILGSVFGLSAAPANSTPFTPETGTGLITGWWQVRYYDQASNQGLVIEQFGVGTVEQLDAGNGQYKPKVKVEIFPNALATGTTTLASLTT